MSEICKCVKKKQPLPHTLRPGEGTPIPSFPEGAQLKLKYISTTLSMHKMDTGSTSTPHF